MLCAWPVIPGRAALTPFHMYYDHSPTHPFFRVLWHLVALADSGARVSLPRAGGCVAAAGLFLAVAVDLMAPVWCREARVIHTYATL